MKKTMILILSIFIFGSTVEAGGGYWAHKIVETRFVNQYFSHIKNGSEIDYEKNLSVNDYSKALSKFYRDYNFNCSKNFGTKSLSRRDLINIYGPVVEDLSSGRKLPFNDIDGLSSRERAYLEKLYDLKILSGIGPREFGLDKSLSQAEGIIAMQNLKNILYNREKLSFKISSRRRLSQANEYIRIRDLGDKIEVSLVYGLKGPLNSLHIDSINQSKTKGLYNIICRIEGPGSIDPKLEKIDYEELKIEIDKGQLKKGQSYDFRLIGLEFPSGL